MKNKPNYGTWIRKNKILTFSLISIFFIFLSFCSVFHLIFFVAILPAAIFIYITFIVVLTYYRFSVNGGDFQNKVHQLIINRIKSPQKILDIGCGNGNVAIKLAKLYPDSKVVGLDYWGKEWEYGLNICKTNAQLENVSNIEFMKDSAANINLPNNSFDRIVSCLTFHEVKDIKMKENCLKEALRLLKLNGRFVFIDLFEDRKYYQLQDLYRKIIIECGCQITEDKKLNKLLKLPFPLNDKRSLGYARLVAGIKKE